MNLITANSYVIDPTGKMRGIVVLRDYRSPKNSGVSWYKVWFQLDDHGKPFRSGVYTIHLELDDGERIRTYHGEWEIAVGVGSPL